MGLFSFSQYDLLNKSQRPRLQRARSHRCRRQPPDSAFAHRNPPRAPPRRNGQPTGSTCAQSAIPCPQDRLKTTSEAQKQIFGPYCNFFVFTKRFSAIRQISKGWIAATASNPAKGGSPQRSPLERHGSLQPQASLVCFNDVHSGGCSPRAVPWSAHGCPLQPQISLCQPGERWAPTAAAGQRERRRALDALPTMQLRPQLRNNQPFTKAK